MRKKFLLPTLLIASACILMTFSILGCSGGTSQTPGFSPSPSDTESPTVSSVEPSDGATDIEQNTSVKVTFSEPVDESTINKTNIVLTGPSGDIAGTLTYESNSNTAVFTPSNRLTLHSLYTAKVSKEVKDTSGNSMETEFSSAFTVREGVWGSAELIENDNAGQAIIPQVAVDSFGNAIVVWLQSDGTRNNICSNRYTFDSGWGTAELIENDNTGNAVNPTVAVDPSGNALAVWRQYDGSYYSIYCNRYTSGVGWGTAEIIETENSGHAINADIAMDSSGNALAVWPQSDGSLYHIWSNRYTPESGWGTAEKISTSYSGDASSPQVAVDSSGNAIAVWYQDDGINNNIWARLYKSGSGWETAGKIESNDAGDALNPNVAIDSFGNAVVVWQQRDALSQFDIWSNHYSINSGWGNATLVENNDAGHATKPRVSTNHLGSFKIIWQQSENSTSNIYCRSYKFDSGWKVPKRVDVNDSAVSINPEISVDPSGNAIAVWSQHDGTRNNIWMNRYISGVGWGNKEMIETDNAGDAELPQTAIDPSGCAIVVWEQSDGIRKNIWSNTFN